MALINHGRQIADSLFNNFQQFTRFASGLLVTGDDHPGVRAGPDNLRVIVGGVGSGDSRNLDTERFSENIGSGCILAGEAKHLNSAQILALLKTQVLIVDNTFRFNGK